MNQPQESGSSAIGAPARRAQERDAEADLWLFTQDHRRLAWMYAVAIGLTLVIGTLLAVGLSLQPMAGRGAGADAEGYRRLYSMHGLIMVFLVALPAIPGIIGNWLLPERLGLAAMAWPRLNLLAFHLLLIGCAFFLVACFASPLDTGWNFALPFALSSHSSIAWGMLGIVFVGASYATSGANVLATVILGRGSNKGGAQLPFFAWAMAAAGLVQALVTPVLLVALALLFAQRSGASDVFAAAGADVQFDRWFWLWAHPALTAMLLGAIAVIGDIFEEHGERRPASLAAVLSVIAIALFAFAGFGVHLFGRGTSAAGDVAFSALVLASGVPFAVLVVDWATSLSLGEARASTALGYAIASAVSMVAAGMAGAFLCAGPTGMHLENTSFVTAQLHFLVVGGTLGALLAGVHQLWPRWFGVPVREGWGMLACVLFVVGLFLAFVPMCVQGYLGQPRRSLALVEGGDAYGWLGVCGAALIVGGLILAAWNLLVTVLDSRAALATKEPA